MRDLVRNLSACRAGATAIEYCLIAALISIVIIGGVNALGGQVQGLYQNVVTSTAGG